MSEDPSKRRLGRGLAALIGDMDQPGNPGAGNSPAPDRKVPIELVTPNPRNPRKNFDQQDLVDLASSIRAHGIVQPVVVRNRPDGQYEIIAGERRWRAAQLGGLMEIPVLIRDVDDRTALEIAIVENIQRSDLNPLEEAQGYEALMAEYGYTQDNLGKVVGKSRSHVANSLRLLRLPDAVRAMLADGSLSAGHARALITTDEPEKLARTIIDRGLSVREAERLANAHNNPSSQNNAKGQSTAKDPDTVALERSLSDHLGLAVQVNHKGDSGQLKISYKSLDQLEKICRLLEGH